MSKNPYNDSYDDGYILGQECLAAFMEGYVMGPEPLMHKDQFIAAMRNRIKEEKERIKTHED